MTNTWINKQPRLSSKTVQELKSTDLCCIWKSIIFCPTSGCLFVFTCCSRGYLVPFNYILASHVNKDTFTFSSCRPSFLVIFSSKKMVIVNQIVFSKNCIINKHFCSHGLRYYWIHYTVYIYIDSHTTFHCIEVDDKNLHYQNKIGTFCFSSVSNVFNNLSRMQALL